MAKSYVKNIWGNIEIVCMNHDQYKKMKVVQNTELIKTAFFACEDYYPDDNEKAHPYCANRLNTDDYQGIVYELSSLIAKDPYADYSHYHFFYKGGRQRIEVRVLKYAPDRIKLGIKNRTVLG